MGSTTHRSATLERWCPRLVLVGGGSIVGHAAINGIKAFTELPPPVDVFGPAGYFLALVGLVGLYPALVDRTPRMARAAAVVAAVPLVTWLVITTWSFGEMAGLVPPQSEVLPASFYVVHLVTLILAYVLLGVASLRADVHPRSVGLLLLVPPVLFVMLMAGAAIFGGSAVGGVVIGSAQAVVHLSIGAVLRANTSTERATAAADMTTG